MKKLSMVQYGKILFEITNGKTGKNLEESVHVFTEFVKKNQAWKKLPKIIQEFERYSKKAEGVVSLVITSALKLSEESVSVLKNRFGKKSEIETKIDPSLIGGVKIQTENTIFDASVKTQLQKMKEIL